MKTYKQHQEDQNALMAKYPKYFNTTGIRTQFSVPPGWLGIVENLLVELSKVVDDKLNFKFVQLKEKFGVLRIYFMCDGHDAKITELVNEAENQSSTVCEVCRSPEGKSTVPNGWVMTLCDEHNHKDIKLYAD